MNRPGRVIAILRPATVVAVGAVAVHQLRYLVAYGGDASRALDQQGHAYLDGLLPVLAVLTGLTILASVVAGLAGAERSATRRSLLLRALVYAAAILVVFGVQEIAEGLLVAGHPGGIGAVAAHGGLVAIPFAFAFGSLALLALRGLEVVEERLGALRLRQRREAAQAGIRPSVLTVVFSPAALAARAAPRAPPSI